MKMKNKKRKRKNKAGKTTEQFRVGIGFDIHRFQGIEAKEEEEEKRKGGKSKEEKEEGSNREERVRKLVLGQVEFDFVGLEGASSDVDVVLHAISDAILGASGSPDIGTIFPPESFRGISSREILERAVSVAEEKGFSIENIDCVIVAQRPKVGDKINDMRKNLRDILGCDINIRVKSPEGLGSLGRAEGISAIAVALLRRRKKGNR